MTFQLQMGRVKWFDVKEGYGFISPVNGGQDIYVNRRAIANTKNKWLKEGQCVEFSITRNAYGIAAADVIAYEF
ncbi:cold shock domain-containing protein [Arsenophonus nasoniae]|nr:cold shock domain-containing protein [Arsenophonus nasoniae]QBY42748.1 Cold shock-like protein CspB [Arsenophonus nasoniae]WGL96153.1 cold shock domain-containing protein [Arsenophonus nasoniae]WGM02635.1 cold shock domain-containing protein [Arsenophonus nasoniae]WGM06812.1 cold shock domain-containing protein [Arsenophonus nasoniae]WGM11763.1 cold shock domain-containing protein [Arsenophonus nasoniae]